MQADIPRRDGPAGRSDNVGDVLASIRRLIAQDDVGRQLPGAPTGPSGASSPRAEGGDVNGADRDRGGDGPGVQDRATQDRGRPYRDGQNWGGQDRGGPLRLDHADLVAPAPGSLGPEAPATAPRLHLLGTRPTGWAGSADFAGGTGWMPAPIADWPLARPADPASIPACWQVPHDSARGGPTAGNMPADPGWGSIAEAPAGLPAPAQTPPIPDRAVRDTGIREGGLSDTRLSDTDFSEAGLSDAGLSDAGLPDTDLSEAEIAEAEAALARMLAPRAGDAPAAPADFCDAGWSGPDPDDGDEGGGYDLLAAPPRVPANLFSEAPDRRGSALHGMIRAAVHHHLEGELGETFSRNLRLLVRQEIAAALEGPGPRA